MNKKNPFRTWMFIQATSLLIATVMAAELNAFFQNVILEKNFNYEPIKEVGIAVPLVFINMLVCYVLSRQLFKYVEQLTNGIADVAQGNFETKLDTSKAGPYKETYENFNKMTAELNSVQTLKNDFINKFSHEFKTPITSINGFAELLTKNEVSEADQRLYLKIIADESARLANLANSVMVLTKLESQNIVLDEKEYDLEEQIKQAAILSLNEINQKDIQLELSLEPAVYTANTELMQHIWTNLLNNAIKYTPEKGKIIIRLQNKEKEIMVSIQDSGVGIEKEELEMIFSKYYQHENKGIETGLGLGLSIVQRVIELTNNSIEVDSTVGQGTTFTVHLKKKSSLSN